jgi:hypothetical protein
MEAYCIVILFLFLQKAKFSYVRRKSVFAKRDILHFRGPFLQKTEKIFLRIFAKINFRPNPSLTTREHKFNPNISLSYYYTNFFCIL